MYDELIARVEKEIDGPLLSKRAHRYGESHQGSAREKGLIRKYCLAALSDLRYGIIWELLTAVKSCNTLTMDKSKMVALTPNEKFLSDRYANALAVIDSQRREIATLKNMEKSDE